VVASPAASFPELSPSVYGMGQIRYTYQGHELIEHNGGTIGFYSTVTRSSHDGLGIAVLTNWDGGAYFMEVVKWRILEKALTLREVDWNERYHKIVDEAARANAQKTALASTDAQGSTLPYYAMAGVYFNPGYGTLSLCAYPPPKHPHPGKECDDLISDAQSSLSLFLNESTPTLLATWPKIWSTHVLLRHFSSDHFNASALYAFPAPFPNASNPDSDDDESRPFAINFESASWQAQFIFSQDATKSGHKVEGMAWKGLWGAGSGVESPQGTGREAAEVWFDRVA